MNFLKIGELARQTDMPVSTIRHYTDLGLIEVATYTKGGQYLYDEEETVERLNYVRELLKRGYQLEQVKKQLGEGRKIKKVLIIDDDPDFAKLVRDVIIDKWAEWDVQITTDVFNTGRKITEFLPDLLVLDLNLPGVDGYSICSEVKKDPVFRHMKILVASSHDTAENKKKILACGADFFFPKPMDMDKLIGKVSELFSLGEPADTDIEKRAGIK